MFPVRTIRTHIPGRVVHESVSFHFVFALEAFAARPALAAGDGAVVRAGGGVHVHVGAVWEMLVVEVVVVLCCVGRRGGEKSGRADQSGGERWQKSGKEGKRTSRGIAS